VNQKVLVQPPSGDVLTTMRTDSERPVLLATANRIPGVDIHDGVADERIENSVIRPIPRISEPGFELVR